MALSNAQRQARYIQRLKERALAAEAAVSNGATPAVSNDNAATVSNGAAERIAALEAENARLRSELLQTGVTNAGVDVAELQVEIKRLTIRLADAEERAVSVANEREQMYHALTKDVEAKLRFADNYRPIVHQHNFAFSQAEYNRFLFCLHPDQTDNRTREERDAVFQLFKERKTKFMVPDKFADKAPPRMSFDEYREMLMAKARGKSKKAKTP